MSCKIVKCPVCGNTISSRIEFVDSYYICGYCDSKFKEDEFDKYQRMFEKALSDGIEVELGNVRHMMDNLLSEEHLKSDEMKKCCYDVLKVIPDDPVATFLLSFVTDRRIAPLSYENKIEELAERHLQPYELEKIAPLMVRMMEYRQKGIVEHFLKKHDIYGDYESQVKDALLKREQEAESYTPYKDVFICHSSKDMDKVNELVSLLEDNTISTWTSETNMPYDTENYWKNIEEAIEETRSFLFVLSSQSRNSKDCMNEVKLAQKYQKNKLFLYRIENVELNIPLKKLFNGVQWIEDKDLLAERMYESLEENEEEEKKLQEEQAREAEQKRLEEEKRIQEGKAREAEQKRLEEEKRILEEKAREAEQKRLEEEKRIQEEKAREAEQMRLEEEKKKMMADLEAEKERLAEERKRLEEEKKIQEEKAREAERKRLEEEKMHRELPAEEHTQVATEAKPSLQPRKVKSKNALNPGDVFEFGTYAGEKISWRVLEVMDGKALILTDKIIESRRFDGSIRSQNNYEASEIRKWLNNDFYNNFTRKEKSRILKTVVDNSLKTTMDKSNPYTCKNTEDYVFLLSVEEVSRYFKNNTERQCAGTAHAKGNGLYVNSDNGYSVWWGRSLAPDGACSARAVHSGGYFGSYDFYCDNGVRPACWIKI